MNQLRLLKRQFVLRFTADASLPIFVGNTIRGALGSALDRMGGTAYGKVFKTDSQKSVPNPYALSAPYPSAASYEKGGKLSFDIILFGNACDFDGDISAAVRNMCQGKLATCELAEEKLLYDRMWSDAGAETVPHTESVTINFLSPTEFLSSKKPVREVDFSTFMDSLFGRICDIIGAYTDDEFVLPYALAARKPLVSADYALSPIDFKTSGQPVYGIVGKATYSGDVTRYLPYIDLGSQIHIGKKTTRSCGQYSFEI